MGWNDRDPKYHNTFIVHAITAQINTTNYPYHNNYNLHECNKSNSARPFRKCQIQRAYCQVICTEV
jgi:hypothetical protein